MLLPVEYVRTRYLLEGDCGSVSDPTMYLSESSLRSFGTLIAALFRGCHVTYHVFATLPFRGAWEAMSQQCIYMEEVGELLNSPHVPMLSEIGEIFSSPQCNFLKEVREPFCSQMHSCSSPVKIHLFLTEADNTLLSLKCIYVERGPGDLENPTFCVVFCIITVVRCLKLSINK